MSRDIVIDENRSFEGIWIPQKLYITNKFSPRTKFFLVELKSLSKCGYCYATDKHFAKFLGISERMVQTIIKDLKTSGYLRAEYEYNEDKKSIKRRFLILTNEFYKEFYDVSQENSIEENCDTPTEKNFNTPTEKKCEEKYNNNSNNNALSIDKGIAYACLETKQGATAYSYKEFEEKLIGIISHNALDDESSEAIFNVIMYFYAEYESRYGRKHPILSEATYKKIINLYYEPEGKQIQGYDLSIDDYKEMINLYFDTTYNKRGKYSGIIIKSLQHFFSGQIRNNLFMRLFL